MNKGLLALLERLEQVVGAGVYGTLTFSDGTTTRMSLVDMLEGNNNIIRGGEIGGKKITSIEWQADTASSGIMTSVISYMIERRNAPIRNEDVQNG